MRFKILLGALSTTIAPGTRSAHAAPSFFVITFPGSPKPPTPNRTAKHLRETGGMRSRIPRGVSKRYRCFDARGTERNLRCSRKWGKCKAIPIPRAFLLIHKSFPWAASLLSIFLWTGQQPIHAPVNPVPIGVLNSQHLPRGAELGLCAESPANFI